MRTTPRSYRVYSFLILFNDACKASCIYIYIYIYIYIALNWRITSESCIWKGVEGNGPALFEVLPCIFLEDCRILWKTPTNWDCNVTQQSYSFKCASHGLFVSHAEVYHITIINCSLEAYSRSAGKYFFVFYGSKVLFSSLQEPEWWLSFEQDSFFLQPHILFTTDTF